MYGAISTADRHIRGSCRTRKRNCRQSEAELRAFAARVNDGEGTLSATLTADIDIGLEAWTPIGTPETAAYSGVFDGDGHTVSGMSINATTGYQGFFGAVNGVSAKILNLTVSGSITVTSTSAISAFGGIVGWADGGALVKGCTSRVDITVDSASTAIPSYLGGVCGWAGGASFEECTYFGTINSGSKEVNCMGGIVAYADGATAIKNCGFYGTITSSINEHLKTGGILGYVDNSAFGGLQNCYSYGSNISCGTTRYNANTGAIVGAIGSKTTVKNITNNYYYVYVAADTTQWLKAWGTNAKSGAMPSGAVTQVTNTNMLGSGELCYKLNGSTTPDGTQAWHQTLGVDASPVPDSGSGIVYYYSDYQLYANTSTIGYYHDNGTSDDLTDDSVEISTAAELLWFASQVNYSGKTQLSANLTADIDLNPGYTFNTDGTFSGGASPVEYLPIGNTYLSRYNGTFEGNNHTISGIYFNDAERRYVGIIGYLAEGKTVRNVHVKNGYIKGGSSVGAICGYCLGTVESCSSDITLSSTYTSSGIGGICGSGGSKSTIKNCLNTGTVTGANFVGGICGDYTDGKIENCLSTGTVRIISRASTNQSTVGSICGIIPDKAVYTNNYYLSGTATDVNGVTQNGIGAASTGSTTADPAGITAISSDKLSTGELCLLLNQNNASGWYQNLGEDATPVPNSTHKPVYFDATLNFYSNYPAPALSDNYYQLDSADDLFWFSGAVNHGHLGINGILAGNIDLNPGYVFGKDGIVSGGSTPKTWKPIADFDGEKLYSGVFDGNGKTISGLYIDENGTDNRGLFSYSSGTIKNLSIENSYICGNTNVGGVCGSNVGTGNITNCTNRGFVSGEDSVGGVCGRNDGENATINNCFNSGEIFSSDSFACVGGVCGVANSGYITNNYNTGSVSSEEDDTIVKGALVGHVVGALKKFENNFYLSGTLSAVGSSIDATYTAASVTEAQFHSGEVTYLLNGSRSEGTTESPLVWFQTCGEGYPAFTGNTVYLCEYVKCNGEPKTTRVFTYRNVQGDIRDTQHNYKDGICDICGAYQPATLVESGNLDEFHLSADYIGYYAIGNAGQLYWFAALVNGTLTDGTAQNLSANGVLTGSFSLNNETFTFNPDTGLVKAEGDFTAYLGTGIKGNGSGANTTFDTEASQRGAWYASDTATDTATDTSIYEAKLRKWTPIGNNFDNKYNGIFDGNGKSVCGLYINDGESDNKGVFGISDGTIKNLNVESGFLCGLYYVGGVCGYNSGMLTGCTNSGVVMTGYNAVGGVCGYNAGTLTDCTNSSVVTSLYTSGGVCGNNYQGTVSQCTNSGAVTGNFSVGGVCGSNNGTTSKCTNSGAVTGLNYVGGVCGWNYGTISECANSGAVTGNSTAGGICGKCGDDSSAPTVPGNVSYCYNTGKTNRAGIVGYVLAGDIRSCYYLSTSATCGMNANITGDNANASPEGQAEPKTAAQFASGEVTWLLNGSRSEGTTESPLVWFQTVGTGYPAYSGQTVYRCEYVKCNGDPKDPRVFTYRNVQGDIRDT
ncbi:MAG: hypothetical protein GX051_00465 [Clostridiales bacterium]|nr:hypothetical protein [Clostridiales bacterium]